MIEAVNSVLANASLSRGSAAQASALAKIDLEAPATPKAPFISPRIALDTTANRAIIQIRDSDTGAVLTQFPSESRIRAIQAEQALRDAQAARLESVERLEAAEVPSAPIPVQSFDAGSLATLQAPQGASTSDIQLATVAFTANASAPAPATSTVSVTA